MKERHINVLHTQDMQFTHDGHDSKVIERWHEVKREYSVMKVKKCNRLSTRLLRSHTISVCEQNGEDKV